MNTKKHYYKINNYHHITDDITKHSNKVDNDTKIALVEETIDYFEVKLMNYLGWDADTIALIKMIDDIEEVKVTACTKNKEQVEKCINVLNKYCAWLEELSYG